MEPPIAYKTSDFSIDHILNKAGSSANKHAEYRLRPAENHPLHFAYETRNDLMNEEYLPCGPMLNWLQYSRYHPPRLPRKCVLDIQKTMTAWCIVDWEVFNFILFARTNKNRTCQTDTGPPAQSTIYAAPIERIGKCLQKINLFKLWRCQQSGDQIGLNVDEGEFIWIESFTYELDECN